MKNELYALEIQGVDGKWQEFPCYTCGHCTSVIMVNMARVRERTTCKKCGRWICEKNELCRLDCTPLHEMAPDHTIDGKWAKYLPAIMAGKETKEDAEASGLIILP